MVPIALPLCLFLVRYEEDPDSIAVNHSLARTYRQCDQHAKADVHLQHALQLAESWVEDNPQSDKAAYWLGKTFSCWARMGSPSGNMCVPTTSDRHH